MKTLSKIIGTLALAGLAFLPSCNTKAQQEAEKQLLEQKIEVYDKLTESYNTKNSASKKLEAKNALARFKSDINCAVEFQSQYLEEEQLYMQTVRFINSYNNCLEGDAHRSDLAGLRRINRYLDTAKRYNQSLLTRIDTLKKAIPTPEPQASESFASTLDAVIKKSKECGSFLNLIETLTKEDMSFLAEVITYSKSKSDAESKKINELAEAARANREVIYTAAIEYRENLAKSTKKLQDKSVDILTEVVPEKKIETREY